MSITRKQFELGIDTEIEQWMRKIHSYLIEHKDQAFTETELATRLQAVQEAPYPREFVVPQTITAAFNDALEKLAEWGVVEARRVKGDTYFSYGPEPLERFLG